MRATIEFDGARATITTWEWVSDNPEFAALLNSMLEQSGRRGYLPSPEVIEAHRIAELLGAKIVEETHTPYDYVTGRIY